MQKQRILLLLSSLVALFVFQLLHYNCNATSNCDYKQQKCGSTLIPYPFTITPDCGLPQYPISCRQNSSLGGDGPLPFLQLPNSTGSINGDEFLYQVLTFSEGSLIINATDFKATSCDYSAPGIASLSIADAAPFAISSSNVFATIGCNAQGTFSAIKSPLGETYTGECTNPCYNTGSYEFCNAYPCCVFAFYQHGVKSINLTGEGVGYAEYPGKCGFSTVLQPNTFTIPPSLGSYGEFGAGQYGLSLAWGIPYTSNESSSCSTVNSTASYACTNNSQCIEVDNISGYACKCSQGYQGDGYKNGTGCENINECAPGVQNDCVGLPYGICTDLPGTYNCSCVDGAIGDGFSLNNNGTGCTKDGKQTKTIIIITVTALFTAAGVTVGCILIWWVSNLRASRARKAENFATNGGNILREFLSKGQDTLRLFSEGELKKASENYADHLELGRGGYGTVFKGFLADGTTVAIKKSNHMDGEAQVQQFANEVIILSKFNHRNIVKLLGCCLETQVPLLVYEYIPNGTIMEHLQGKHGKFLSWETRLMIALESAEALAYLHFSISTPIFHRDVKSSNILLDNTLTPKLADFGISRILPKDQTHVSTLVQGTLGYLDPEYFQTFQFTDKSDVYSFGVVLLELITSLKPVAADRNENEVNLPMMCMSRWASGTFSTIIDPYMGSSENPEMMSSIHRVAKLALDCLHVEGRKRPSMRSVFNELLNIRGSKEDTAERGDLKQVKVVDEKQYQETEALIPSLQRSHDLSFSLSTGASSSNAISGHQAMEMVFMKSPIKEGR